LELEDWFEGRIEERCNPSTWKTIRPPPITDKLIHKKEQTMTEDHTASVEECNAARLPLGYRDSCSA